MQTKADTSKSTELQKLLTRREFCEQYGISTWTAERYAHKGEGPRVTRLGRRAFYHVDDINEWVEAQRKKARARFGKEPRK